MKNKKLARNIYALVILAIGAVLVFIWDSGMLKTDREYWIVFTLLGILVIVNLPILIIMARKSILEAEEKRVKKMIDKNNKEIKK